MIFISDNGYYPHLVYIICILWKSIFCGYYPHFLDIIRILWILCIYLHFADITCISHFTTYLPRNASPICNIYSYSVSDWCITSFPVCNLIYFSSLSYFCIVCFVSEYKLDNNPIRIYVPNFITPIKVSFSFPINFSICVLYWPVV